jgi:hypothetical protein
MNLIFSFDLRKFGVLPLERGNPDAADFFYGTGR